MAPNQFRGTDPENLERGGRKIVVRGQHHSIPTTHEHPLKDANLPKRKH